MAWPEAFRALQHRNFKLFFVGQMLNMSGTWMQRVAVAWLAYELSGSPLLLGYVGFASSAPAVVLSPLAGVLVDRFNPHRLLILAQILGMVQSTILGLMTLTGAMTPGLLVVFALILGVITAFENPVRQTFFVEMVPREDLPNAIALNSAVVSVARIAGPAVAGIILAAYGAGVCFLINSVSFVAVLIALIAMKLGWTAPAAARDSGIKAMFEGLAFIRNNRTTRSVLTLFLIASFAGSPYLTLLPILAGDVLRAGSQGLGWLVTSSGVGAIAASLLMAVRPDRKELPHQFRYGTLMFGGATMVLGASRSFTLSMAMMFLIGGGFILTVAGTQTILQTVVTNALRGRVMSFYSLSFVGMPPFGSLVGGWLADWIGTPITVFLSGALCFVAAWWYPAHPIETGAVGS
jgi:MFS family permease